MGRLKVDRILFNNLIFATGEQVAAQAECLQHRFQAPWNNLALDHRTQIGIDPEVIDREMAAIRSGPWSDLTYMAPPGVEGNLGSYYAPHVLPFERLNYHHPPVPESL